MTAEIPKPLSPWKRLVHVCDQCDQPWGEHLKLARRRWHECHPDALDDPTLDVIEEWVHLGDCIVLLKLANAGPPGPQGPAGCPGRAVRRRRGGAVVPRGELPVPSLDQRRDAHPPTWRGVSAVHA